MNLRYVPHYFVVDEFLPFIRLDLGHDKYALEKKIQADVFGAFFVGHLLHLVTKTEAMLVENSSG